MRLDRLLCQHPKWNRRHVLILLARGQVQVNGQTEHYGEREIRVFDKIEAEGELIQAGRPIHHLMLNKPVGILSATSDPVHQTVLDLLPGALRPDLHIAGRLDRASSGLILLTNDGLWSRRATAPELEKPKIYLVTTANPIHPDTAARFAEGMHFPYEDIVTKPVKLEQLDDCLCRLTLLEGRYHQIKRMFGRFRNPVTGLHREAMGDIVLDPTLAPGQYRALTDKEIASF